MDSDSTDHHPRNNGERAARQDYGVGACHLLPAISGYCSLSIYACMLPAKNSHFYNNYIVASYIAKQCVPKDIDLSLYKGFQNATNIIELSRDLKLRIKIFGNNLKNDTMEWYEINNGQITNSFSD